MRIYVQYFKKNLRLECSNCNIARYFIIVYGKVAIEIEHKLKTRRV